MRKHSINKERAEGAARLSSICFALCECYALQARVQLSRANLYSPKGCFDHRTRGAFEQNSVDCLIRQRTNSPASVV